MTHAYDINNIFAQLCSPPDVFENKQNLKKFPKGNGTKQN